MHDRLRSPGLIRIGIRLRIHRYSEFILIWLFGFFPAKLLIENCEKGLSIAYKVQDRLKNHLFIYLFDRVKFFTAAHFIKDNVG